MKKSGKHFCIAIALLAAFALWTCMLQIVDVKPIGPLGSNVGFTALNQLTHRLTGVHFTLYHITDWLGLVPIFVCVAFGILGLTQWIGRRGLRLVDRGILALGGFYLVTMAVYLFFEAVVINYRPVLIGGNLEASYPSSTTVLTLCVMLTARMQLRKRIQSKRLRRIITLMIDTFSVFMVLGRLLSGVHWITDILGGVLLSFGLVKLYDAVLRSLGDA